MRILKSRFLRGAAVLAGVYLASKHGLLDVLAGFGLVGLTVPPTLPARDEADYRHSVKYFRKRFQFSDLTAITAGVKIGRLPANALITYVTMWSSATPFNAGTTNTLQIGSTQAGTDIMVATALPAASTLTTTTTIVGAGLALANAAEVDVWVKYAQTGGAATAGDATFLIGFIINNDN